METKILLKIKQGVKEPEKIDNLMAILEKNIQDRFLLFHSLRTALILKEVGGEEKLIIAGLLHHIPLSDIASKVEKDILDVLKKFHRLEEFCYLGRQLRRRPIKKWKEFILDERAENLRKMLFVITKDLLPVFVMLAGRLDEMRHLKSFDKDEQSKKSLETLEIFAPLAFGLGMGEIKGELEDLAFPYVYPKEYQWLIENVKEQYSQREKYLEKIKPLVTEMLKNEKINVLSIDARAKHYFSLYQKLLRFQMNLDKIYDLVALRIIVSNIENCYRALGIIHKRWEPLIGRIKDYISSPKPSGYRSLHTTVKCEENKIIEFQIKTQIMYKEAEYGAFAHLSYKLSPEQKTGSGSETYKEHVFWIEQIRKWREEIQDAEKISEYLETDLFPDQIFVLTPRGDVINLPKGATPIDFAYAIHSEVGDYCAGAKIDGKITALDKKLETGQTVEILIDKNRTPSYDWLKFVKTKKAHSKIKDFFQKVYGLPSEKPLKIKKPLKERLPLLKKILPLKKKEKISQILVAGQPQISVKFSKCCSPKTGDEVFAFITKGYTASLHKANCENLKELQEKWPQRIVSASWSFKERKL